ncbi:MAG: AbrB/MazE/SpoVT family DNA-binding domain-containing protein [Gemmatimonas sp.]|nr:AbrB/MazE/SpoVT family DNA-binding domain-containing protein [Gemmatimonas sp.]
MGREDRARLFWTDGWQAVRLPNEYRFEGTEVRIHRCGDAVILEPLPTDWRWLDELISAGLDTDFVEALEDRAEVQERPGLESLFD